MTEVLHRLIDNQADQSVVNERIAGLMETTRKDIERIGTDHEKRLRYLERTMAWALGGIGAVASLIVIVKQLLK